MNEKIIGLHKYKTIDNKDGTVTVKGELLEPYKTIFKQEQKLREQRIKTHKEQIEKEINKSWWEHIFT